MDQHGLRGQRRAVLAGVAGNVMEWYDFSVYGYFAAIIGNHFFPTGDRTSSLIAAFGVFAAGFFMRPLGSILFGYIGDKKGRKLALTISVGLMAVPTFLIAVLPTYQQIGLWGSLSLVLLRLLQGLSVGGELGRAGMSKGSLLSKGIGWFRFEDQAVGPRGHIRIFYYVPEHITPT